MIESINLDNGKYVVQLIDNGRDFKALRYGEEWRSLVGDNLVLLMFYKIQELEQQLQNSINGTLESKRVRAILSESTEYDNIILTKPELDAIVQQINPNDSDQGIEIIIIRMLMSLGYSYNYNASKWEIKN